MFAVVGTLESILLLLHNASTYKPVTYHLHHIHSTVGMLPSDTDNLPYIINQLQFILVHSAQNFLE